MTDPTRPYLRPPCDSTVHETHKQHGVHLRPQSAGIPRKAVPTSSFLASVLIG